MKHQPMLTGRVLGYRAVQVLAYVREEITRTGKAPTYDMICDALGISSRGKVSLIVQSLEKRALLRRVGYERVRHIGQGNRRIALP